MNERIIGEDEAIIANPENLELVQKDSDGQNKQWKDLTDFILNQDVQVFRTTLNCINQEIYKRWKQRATSYYQRSEAKKDFNNIHD